MTVLRQEILLDVSKKMLRAIDQQRHRAVKHPEHGHYSIVALKVPVWLYRILRELGPGVEEPIFYGFPVIANSDDEICVVWWDPTMDLNLGVPWP